MPTALALEFPPPAEDVAEPEAPPDYSTPPADWVYPRCQSCDGLFRFVALTTPRAYWPPKQCPRCTLLRTIAAHRAVPAPWTRPDPTFEERAFNARVNAALSARLDAVASALRSAGGKTLGPVADALEALPGEPPADTPILIAPGLIKLLTHHGPVVWDRLWGQVRQHLDAASSAPARSIAAGCYRFALPIQRTDGKSEDLAVVCATEVDSSGRRRCFVTAKTDAPFGNVL